MSPQRTVPIIAIAVIVAAAIPAVATADPLSIDHQVPPNGTSTPQYPRTPLLTPAISPVQVPAPKVTTSVDAPGAGLGTARPIIHRTYTYYPYFSPAVHDAVPVPGGTALDAIGAISVTLPTATGERITLNPNGHCLFSGPGFDEVYAAAHPEQWVSPQPIIVDTPVVGLHIEPRFWVPQQRVPVHPVRPQPGQIRIQPFPGAPAREY